MGLLISVSGTVECRLYLRLPMLAFKLASFASRSSRHWDLPRRANQVTASERGHVRWIKQLELEGQTYIRPSQLARILGWSRPNVYYWLRKCEIEVVLIAGYQMVPISDLARLVMTLTKAKQDAYDKRHFHG
jgi:hypothetical protein